MPQRLCKGVDCAEVHGVQRSLFNSVRALALLLGLWALPIMPHGNFPSLEETRLVRHDGSTMNTVNQVEHPSRRTCRDTLPPNARLLVLARLRMHARLV
jgi:hypothetical protein